MMAILLRLYLKMIFLHCLIGSRKFSSCNFDFLLKFYSKMKLQNIVDVFQASYINNVLAML